MADGATEIKVSDRDLLNIEGLAGIFERTQDIKQIYKEIMNIDPKKFQDDDIILVMIKG
ncbi:MAG: hypothetical protein J7L34_08120 [Thermotogaceae bacterium]|nr:hypothetical protein [Thermotogaceae bacterium]